LFSGPQGLSPTFFYLRLRTPVRLQCTLPFYTDTLIPLPNKPTTHFYTSPPIRALFISTNSIFPCSHQPHSSIPLTSPTLPHTQLSSTNITHFSKWQSPNNILLLDFTNIEQLNIRNSTAAPTHYVSILITHLIYSFSKKNFKIFLGPFPGPPGLLPRFRFPLLPLRTLKIFPDVSTSFLSESHSATPTF